MNPFLRFAFALLFVAPFGKLQAQVPQLISYQGRVGVDGVNFDGSGQFKFAFVNAAGTTTYWSNDGSSTAGSEPGTAITLPVSKGLYSILLGDATLSHMSIVPATVFTKGDVHLRVWFSDGVNGFQQLAPDRRIAAVGYAMMADSVSDGAITTAKIADGAVTSEKLAAGVVQTANLATGAVGNTQLANSGLTISAGTGLGGGGLVSLGGNLTLSNAGVLSLTGGGGITVDAGTGAINLGSNATSAGTAGAIVARDANGGFTAGTITAALNGNAATANTAISATNFTGTLAGDVTGSQSATAIADATVTGKLLTGFTSAAGTIAATDSILSAINKLNGNTALKAPLASPSFTGNVTLPAGSAITAPLLLQTGTNLTTPTFGAVEFDGANVYVTNNSANPTRKTVAFTDTMISASQIADGSVTSAKLASGAAAANLSASGQSGVPSGGLVLATSENPSLVSAGYSLVSSTLPNVEWKSQSAISPPSPRFTHSAIWTGSEMIIWGGYSDSFFPQNTGGRYNPATNVWVPISTNGAPTARNGPQAIWTGTEMIVWGGDNAGVLNTGGRYNPTNDTWTAISMTDAPIGSYTFPIVWTGSEMIVWGGYGSSGSLNTGGRYNPTTDTWTTITTAGAPTARQSHTAVWTGTEMIIWGGNNFPGDSFFNDGWRYNPTTDSWSKLSAINAPSGRNDHAAVWTGSKMIVFGGYAPEEGVNGTGALYDPLTDTWTAIPSAMFRSRSLSAIWTGTEMIVWGGYGPGDNLLDTGGRFNPVSNSWTPTSRDAPAARVYHTAVWTGTEMLIWGGFDGARLLTNETYIYTPTRKLYLYQRP